MILFHIAPRFIRAEPAALPELLDVTLPELNIKLQGGTDLRLIQLGLNPKNLVVCRAGDTAATHGFLIQTPQRPATLTVQSRYRLHSDHGGHTVLHETHHPLLDTEFDGYSTDPRFLDPSERHHFGSRWNGAWGNVLALTPLMQIYPDKRTPLPRYRPVPAEDTLSDAERPVILRRAELLSLPSIEPARLFAGLLVPMPRRADAFTTT